MCGQGGAASEGGAGRGGEAARTRCRRRASRTLDLTLRWIEELLRLCWDQIVITSSLQVLLPSLPPGMSP